MLRPPPLRTARASFDASSSSLSQALRDEKRPGASQQHLCDTHLQPTRPKGGRPHQPVVLAIICFVSSSWFLRPSRTERPDGSQHAFAWGNVARKAQPLSTSLQDGIRLLHPPLPALLRARLTTCFPLQGRSTGLPRSTFATEWVRPRLYAGDTTSAAVEKLATAPGHAPFGPSLSAPLACLR